MARRVVLWAHNQAAALLGTTVDGLDDIYELLFVFDDPLDLVVVASAQIDHHVLVAPEEHDRAWIIELVHYCNPLEERAASRTATWREPTFVEVGNLLVVTDVDDGKVLHLGSNAREHVVLSHAVRVAVFAKADDHNAVGFREDGLVNMPGLLELRDNKRAHVLRR